MKIRVIFFSLCSIFTLFSCAQKPITEPILLYDSCPDAPIIPSSTTSVVPFDQTQHYEIGFTTHRTNLPNGRYPNNNSQRANLLSTATLTYREVAPQIITRAGEEGSGFFGWSPDGRYAVIPWGWEDPSNAVWEEANHHFRYESAYYDVNSYLVDVDNGDTTEGITAINPVSFFNTNVSFWPISNKLSFISLINGYTVPYVMNRDGSGKTPLLADSTVATYGLSISPNEKNLTYHSSYKVYITDPDGSNRRKVNVAFDFSFGPHWSADSKRVEFTGKPNDRESVFLLDVDHWKLTELANRGGYSGVASLFDVPDFGGGASDSPTWDPVGKWIYFTRQVGSSVELFRVSGSKTDDPCRLEQLTVSATPIWRAYPQVSPDNKYVAYISAPNGVRQLTVLNLTTLEESYLTNFTAGYAAAWPYWRP